MTVTRHTSPAHADVEQAALLEPQHFLYLHNVHPLHMSRNKHHMSQATTATCHKQPPPHVTGHKLNLYPVQRVAHGGVVAQYEQRDHGHVKGFRV